MKVNQYIGAVCAAIFRVLIAIVVIYAIYRGVKYSYDYGYRIFAEPPVAVGQGRVVTVTVTEDMSPKSIGEMFEEQGLVRDGKLFAIQYYLSEFRKEVKPGTFDLSTAMTAEEMMEVMARQLNAGAEDLEAP